MRCQPNWSLALWSLWLWHQVSLSTSLYPWYVLCLEWLSNCDPRSLCHLRAWSFCRQNLSLRLKHPVFDTCHNSFVYGVFSSRFVAKCAVRINVLLSLTKHRHDSKTFLMSRNFRIQPFLDVFFRCLKSINICLSLQVYLRYAP